MKYINRKFKLIIVSLSLLGSIHSCPLFAESPKVELLVQADNVNLRAKPDMDSEVIGQLNFDSTVIALQLMDDWVQIEAPESVNFWIHGDMLSGDKVKKSRVNVRTGPGINYSVMASLERNREVVRRGEFNEWVKIAPPRESRVWIHRKFLKMIKKESVVEEPAVTGNPEKIVEPVASEVDAVVPVTITVEKEVPPAPSKYNVIPLEGQGKVVRELGRLESYLITSDSPSKYFLVDSENGATKTICYIDSDFPPLKKYKRKRVIVQGRQYWLHGETIPVIVPQAIIELNRD